MTARVDSVKPRVDAVVAKVDGEGGIGKRAATGVPTKVVLDTDKELPRLDQGVERIETATAARVGGVARTDDSLGWHAETGKDVDRPDQVIVEVVFEVVIVSKVAAAV